MFVSWRFFELSVSLIHLACISYLVCFWLPDFGGGEKNFTTACSKTRSSDFTFPLPRGSSRLGMLVNARIIYFIVLNSFQHLRMADSLDFRWNGQAFKTTVARASPSSKSFA